MILNIYEISNYAFQRTWIQLMESVKELKSNIYVLLDLCSQDNTIFCFYFPLLTLLTFDQVLYISQVVYIICIQIFSGSVQENQPIFFNDLQLSSI
jgi:hypothetical protein